MNAPRHLLRLRTRSRLRMAARVVLGAVLLSLITTAANLVAYVLTTP